jgi:methyl coenzyme M reductase beta subunit
MQYSVYNLTSGEILKVVSCPSEQIAQQCGENESAIFGGYDDDKFIVVDGQPVEKSFSLSLAVSLKLEDINLRYALANTGTFNYLGVAYNGDNTAQANFNSTANYINNFNDYPDNFPGGWIADDGSVLELPTVADFWPLYKAFVGQGVFNINHFVELKAQILALPNTATQQDLDAIQW